MLVGRSRHGSLIKTVIRSRQMRRKYAGNAFHVDAPLFARIAALYASPPRTPVRDADKPAGSGAPRAHRGTRRHRRRPPTTSSVFNAASDCFTVGAPRWNTLKDSGDHRELPRSATWLVCQRYRHAARELLPSLRKGRWHGVEYMDVGT